MNFRGKTASERARLVKSSNNLSYASGLIFGLSRGALTKKSFQLGIAHGAPTLRRIATPTKLGKYGYGLAAATAVASTVQNIRGADGVGDAILNEVTNRGRNILGSIAGNYAGKTVFRRIRGRIIPVRIK